MNKFFRILSALLVSVILISAGAVVSFADEPSAELLGITVGNLSISDFDPSQTEYEVPVPYKYKENDFETVDVPIVAAYAKDPAAEVTVTQAESIDSAATIEVTNADASNTYTVSFAKSGMNMYGDGGFETNSWVSAQKWTTALPCTLYTDNPKAGDSAFKYTTKDAFPWGYPEGLALSNGVRYLLTYYTCEPGNSNISWYGGNINGNYFSEKTYYNVDGSKRSGDSLGKLTSNWTRIIQTYTPNRNIEGNQSVKFGPINFNGKYDVVLDEMYLAPLEVTDIIYTGEKNIIVPLEGTDEVTLTSEIKNQLGASHGLEDLTVSYSLMDTYSGITLDGDVLTVDTTASDCTVLVKMEVAHSFSGTEETVSNIVPISVETPKASKAELLTIRLGGLSIPGFNSMIKDYDFKVPYSYIPGDFETVEVPKVEYLAADENAEVNISYPDTADGGVITIDVTCGDDSETYTIRLSTVGLNIYDDGGFETDAWVDANSYRTDIDGSSVKLSSLSPKAGSTALSYLVPNGKMLYAPLTPTLTGGTTYIRSLFVRQPDDGGIQMFNGSSGGDVSKHYNENGTLKSGDSVSGVTKSWTQLISTHLVNSTKTFMGSPFHYASNSFTAEIDELFMAPMVITGITYTGDNIDAAIPETADGEVRITLGARMSNALGGTHGLEDSKIKYGFAYDYSGVSIEGNQLVVTQDAVDGPIVLTMTADTSFKSVQGTIVNTVTGYLRTTADDAAIPKVRYLEIHRNNDATDYTIDGSFSYYHALGESQGDTRIVWQHGLSQGGSFEDIPNAEGLSYVVADEYRNHYIRLAVTPVTESGVEGSTYYSNVITPPTVPSANNVYIDGVYATGEELTGKYSYYDVNDDSESGTSFSWLISDSEHGPFEPIEGAETEKYTIRQDDIDKYIIFRVTPSASVEPFTGVPSSSDSHICATYPTVSDVEIVKKSTGLYAVSYKYNHEANIGEGATKVEWLSGSRVIGSKNSIDISDSVDELTVRVTPVAIKPPYEGIAVTKTIDIESKSSGSVRKPSSGGGGGASIIVPVPEVKEEAPAAPEPVKHWAEDGIAFCKANGIMQDVAQGDFGNSQIVTRAELVSYIIKTLGEKEAAYSYEFHDVSGTDYFAGALQKAVDLGIISRAENFEPHRNVTRQEVAKILVAALGEDITTSADLTKFVDNASIADWAVDWVSKSVSKGILKGVSDYEFNPLGSITREQTAVLLKRIYDLRNGGTVE
ncbi:MAG: S-layer homology domain-containing protein [Clostridia bacterium]|nr:S-layer homology domain-containing protein [Clostridia bacterium]